jgi:predicted dinucleotide-binding enzyme
MSRTRLTSTPEFSRSAATRAWGERIQKAFPQARVVKSLNTMNVSMMFGQQSHPGHHNVFMAGNEANAKGEVARLLEAIGWRPDTIIDLGGIEAARGTEHWRYSCQPARWSGAPG